jgi:hypothetical protein
MPDMLPDMSQTEFTHRLLIYHRGFEVGLLILTNANQHEQASKSGATSKRLNTVLGRGPIIGEESE